MKNDNPTEHENKTFEKINYQGQVVEDRKFINCIFKNCTLAETFFKDCLFEDCVFDNCDLSLMKVDKSISKNYSLSAAKPLACSGLMRAIRFQ